jgi:carbon monoxide dehydrogenase subunit G
MELENSFDVPVPVDEAWALLLDVERVALCMPGATLESIDGDEMKGRVKVKVGPISMTFKGTARFVDRDDENHSLAMRASGKDVRGSGGANATMRMSLTDLGAATRCTVKTDLAVTGKPAQFGRGVMSDVSSRLIGQFAKRLAEEVENPSAAGVQEPAAPAEGASPVRPTAPSQSDDAIDLLGTFDPGSPVRLGIPAALVVLVCWLLFRSRRRS